MERKQLEKFRSWFDNYVDGFYNNDDFVNAHLKLKQEHTLRVCREMQFLANELGLAENQKRIAEVIALFHDIGRFKQFIKYRMYNDVKTVSHSLLGLEVLKEEKVLEDVDKEERELIEKAIEYHGLKELPGDLNGQCLLLSKLIRDADKLDVFYVATEYFKHYKNKQKKVFLELGVPDEPGYSHGLVEAILNGRQIDYNHVRTLNDMKLLQLGWVYDVNFPPTLKRIKQRKFLEMLLGFLPQTEDIQKVEEKILGYVDSRCEEIKKKGIIMETVLQTNITEAKSGQGKVRDIYDLGDKLLIVATDRISAFDVVMANGIPYKGIVLTQISLFWFDFLSGDVEHHLISDDVKSFPQPFCNYGVQLAGRSMLVKKVDVLPIECVVRGYLAGSGWKEYKVSQRVCGVKLPAGLKQCEKLPEPIFTPATKAERGTHDENISFEQSVDMVGREQAQYVRDKSIEIFKKAGKYAESKGLILADTKFEWGITDGKIILIDEVLTPDSSRFWPANKYKPGRDQESFDKQFVRNYLESINFDKSGPGVELPKDIVAKTSQKYIEAYEQLTGKKFHTMNNPQ